MSPPGIEPGSSRHCRSRIVRGCDSTTTTLWDTFRTSLISLHVSCYVLRSSRERARFFFNQQPANPDETTSTRS
eukprot:scaffold195749_cov35-Prasinocladus_malaysianus.AAC.1